MTDDRRGYFSVDDLVLDSNVAHDRFKTYCMSQDRLHAPDISRYLTEIEDHKHQMHEMIKEREFELSEAKEMLIRMQKMESLAFLAVGFSHDLQNMNSVMMSAVTSLEHGLAKTGVELPDNIGTYVNLIKQANVTATDLVVKLKGLFEEKQKEFNDFNLMDIINHVVDICRCTFPRTVSTWGCSDVGQAYLHGDQVSLEQALLNLCINACHAMTIMRNDSYAGGAIKVCLSSCRRSALAKTVKHDSEWFWKLSISDTGVGMDEKTISKIFNPMFTTKKKGVGTGLGLLMIQHIVSAHHGVIEVESVVGAGTTFHLFLPKTLDHQPSLFESNF